MARLCSGCLLRKILDRYPSVALSWVCSNSFSDIIKVHRKYRPLHCDEMLQSNMEIPIERNSEWSRNRMEISIFLFPTTSSRGAREIIFILACTCTPYSYKFEWEFLPFSLSPVACAFFLKSHLNLVLYFDSF